MTEQGQPQPETPFEEAPTDANALEQDDTAVGGDESATSGQPEPGPDNQDEPGTAERPHHLSEDPGHKPTVESVIEAVLFASDEPLPAARLASIVEVGPKQVRQHIQDLNRKYRENHNSFRIEQIAGGYQMLTLSCYGYWLKKLLRARSDTKLSPAALETLAVIAYKQPVLRADIEAVRGVAAGEVIRGLMYKGLVKIVGRAEVLGRPMLYGTTKKFLEVFGLNSLKDLPKVEELKEPPA